MDLIVTGVVAGVLGTLVMDSLNYLFARTGMISRIEVALIGRMSAEWVRGRSAMRIQARWNRSRMRCSTVLLRTTPIGVCLAVPYVLGWAVLGGGSPSPLWALVYGAATTVASWFFVYPSMGMGVFGRLSPEGMKAPLSSLANHLFYGVGLAVGVALV